MKYFLCKVKVILYTKIDDIESGSSFEEYRLVQAKNEKDVEEKIKNYYKTNDDESKKNVVFSVTIYETIK
jgi:hypothetical protein